MNNDTCYVLIMHGKWEEMVIKGIIERRCDLSTLNKIFLTLTPNSSSDVKISSTQTTNLYKNIKSTLQKNKEHLNIYKEYECIIKFIIMIDSYDMLKTKKKYLEYKGK